MSQSVSTSGIRDPGQVISFRCLYIHVLKKSGKIQMFGNDSKNQLHSQTIKNRLNFENACCHSVWNLLSSHLLSKNIKIIIYKTVITLLVLYGCETWSLTLREELRLRVSENKMLRRIFGHNREEVTGRLRKLCNEELHNLYSSPNHNRMIKSRRIR
jgi:hypothetical protein